MRSAPRVVVILAVCSLPATAQSLIEVVSVRANPQAGVNFAPKGISFQPGRLHITNFLTEELVATAYGVMSPLLKDRLIVGWPDAGIKKKGFDIVANLTTDEPLTPEQQQQVVREVLQTRFGFKAHVEKRPMEVHRLVQAKPGVLGPGLKAVRVDCSTIPTAEKPKDCIFDHRTDRFRGFGDIKRLSVSLETTIALSDRPQILGALPTRPIIDATGLTGFFVWDSRRPLAEGIQDDLGLKLEPAQGAVSVVVIDAIRIPTPN